jgi:hypothetical protein
MTSSPTPQQPRAPLAEQGPPPAPGAPQPPQGRPPHSALPPAEAPAAPVPQSAPLPEAPAAEYPEPEHPAPLAQAPAPPAHHLPASPRSAPEFGSPAHRRQIRLEAILRSCSEQPDLLVELLGIDTISDALGLPRAAVERMIAARPSVRRRFARRVREAMGLSPRHLEAARFATQNVEELMRAALCFAVAIRLAGMRRVMPRAAFLELTRLYGADSVAFAFEHQRHLAEHAEILAEYREETTPSATDLRLFVRSLAAYGDAAAPVVAIKLGFPASLATVPVANIDLALETGLPALAAAALAHAGGLLPPEAPEANETAWREDASQDLGEEPDAEDMERSEGENEPGARELR